jgi:membrane fusion protein (multidrug efflux system)
MDQRVDDERRQETLPGRPARPTAAERQQEPSLIEGLRARRTLVLAIAAIAIAVAVGSIVWWINSSHYLSTDDAFIDARTVTISAQINAQVADVPVTDNQFVEAGTVLVRLDRGDYQAQTDQAKAQVDQAHANIANLNAQIAAQQARIEEAKKQATQAQAALTFAEQQNERYQRLLKTGTVTVEQAQQYNSSFLQAQATFAAAEANATATEKQLPVLQSQALQAQAQLEQMQAGLDLAQVNLGRTEITAPVAGYVTQLTAAKGQFAAAGQALMMFVPRDVWVTANFKETELASIRPGQPVDIAVDAFPKHTFTGHVDSVQAGSGTAFSLLPAQNATGNYVKITQRVPVKIVIADDRAKDMPLSPGLSVVPSIRVRE